MRIATLCVLAVVLVAGCSQPGDGGQPPTGESAITSARAAHPDLSGTYDIATLTPLQRPEEFGENLYLSPEEADRIVREAAALTAERDRNRGVATAPPPVGGAPPVGLGEEFLESSGAGSVGGYNNAYVDRGDDVVMVDGKFRTSIITTPANGRMPSLTPAAMKAIAAMRGSRRTNTGTAWWLEVDGPGPYDDPESLGDSERCLTGFGSTGGPPMLPVMYNNLKRIVQTDDHVMILVEMVHDARIVRLDDGHAPSAVRKWLGDSIGWWEGDTLVVDTTNFTDSPGLFMASKDLHVVERFTRLADGNLLYQFTVEDPNVWTEPWGGEYVWPATSDQLYEYACHEGNYAMESILKGARLLEQEALAEAGGG